ncbi:MAG: sarcosine oxidase subunit alpha family protein [Rhodobacteraceae bacterium]|jgi:sarcosine oxidase subunit alpha|nr:sarcosine oxidase subunit alpha family protein [Paracoccaceae bacterium]
MSGYRLTSGGNVDRQRPVRFAFDGRPCTGLAGDTLASALLAEGIRLVGRSFKYHRPRGVLGIAAEEPNALVSLRGGGRHEPNIQATMAELHDGLEVRSQNAWPSLGFDALAVNGLAGPLFGAGFYYKTFMGPTRRAWMWFEPFIRRAAGLGPPPRQADPDVYDRNNLFCDVLVVGGGPAGLAAARAAAECGARVALCDERAAFGGSLRGAAREIGDVPAQDWIDAQLAFLAGRGAVLLPRTGVFGYYDGETLGAVERVADHLPAPSSGQPRQRYWTIRTAEVVLATGAVERPVLFAGNDRPGVMLADSVRQYAETYGVACGRSVTVLANNDSGHAAARSLAAAGVTVARIFDQRPEVGPAIRAIAVGIGADLRTGWTVVATHGGKGLHAVTAAPADGSGRAERFETDCLAMAGGWTPAIALASQRGSAPVWSDALGAPLAGVPAPGARWRVAGAAAGRLDTAGCLAEGAAAGHAAARAAGFDAAPSAPPACAAEPVGLHPAPVPRHPDGKAFVDFQNDVKCADVALALREGYVSVEHLKRYTTLGMATDQGRTANVNAIALMAAATGRSPGEVGTTRFRAPAAPVALGALAGRHTGAHFQAVRRTPVQDWHVRHGGVLSPVGPWLRPRAYLREGETIRTAYIREAANVRGAVGLCDVSTLGKIAVEGPDAAVFLDRVYSNAMQSLAVGRARYGLMLRDDGMVLDDGTAWRLSETSFLVTTTTTGAGAVMTHLERLHALFWPGLRVALTSVTSQWAGMSLAGPRSREVLAAALPGTEVGNGVLPFMGLLEARMDGAPVLVARLSFSGERAYEVFCGADHGEAVWERLLQAGRPHGIMPYGTEALGTLRIEKGHVAGGELDGRVSPFNLGLEGLLSRKKAFFGSALLERPGLHAADRYELVGLVSTAGVPLRAGSHLAEGPRTRPGPSQGFVSSTTFSPATGQEIALALVKGGRARIGQDMFAADPVHGAHHPVRLAPPCFVDPEGARMRG